MDSQVDEVLKTLRETLAGLEQLAEISKHKQDVNKAVQSLRDIIATVEKIGQGQ